MHTYLNSRSLEFKYVYINQLSVQPLCLALKEDLTSTGLMKLICRNVLHLCDKQSLVQIVPGISETRGHTRKCTQLCYIFLSFYACDKYSEIRVTPDLGGLIVLMLTELNDLQLLYKWQWDIEGFLLLVFTSEILTLMNDNNNQENTYQAMIGITDNQGGMVFGLNLDLKISWDIISIIGRSCIRFIIEATDHQVNDDLCRSKPNNQ